MRAPRRAPLVKLLVSLRRVKLHYICAQLAKVPVALATSPLLLTEIRGEQFAARGRTVEHFPDVTSYVSALRALRLTKYHARCLVCHTSWQ